MRALQEVNRRAMELQDRDRGAPTATRRMTFGLYFYRDDEDGDEDRGGDRGAH